MDSLLKSDIFFFITGGMVLIAGFLIAIALFYIIRIIRDIKKISKTVQEETDNLAHDLQNAREKIYEEGVTARSIMKFFSKSKPKRPRKTTKTKKK